MGSFNPTPNFDNLLLQTLMGRLQIHPPNTPTPHSPQLLQQTLEDLLFDAPDLSDSETDSDPTRAKSQLAIEESKIEKEIIRTILAGGAETLKPNSGQAVTIGEHHICVGFHLDRESDYRVWEWHGHVMLFDEENGYSPEYIYGNYFERVKGNLGFVVKDKSEKCDEKVEEEEEEEEEEEKMGNLGLRELIGSGDSGGGRVLHRNLNSGSTRF
ncbi:uncharacterized protein LOC130795871 [Actinidia eriantha]|uniref:uncharacterized protein LOC130795871 n=1 Tax=Actinidia eriantha TaxID=165200 RepID=UPI002582AFA7|nr:uncharacterized protein LOC130795871 [Actinidia eriantha]